MDEFLGFDAERSNSEFDIWRNLAASINDAMSAGAGWKNPGRPLDFRGFTGFHIDDEGDRIEFCLDEDILCVFRPTADGCAGWEIFSPELFLPEGVDDPRAADLMKIINDSCLSDENVGLARRETHGGHEVIFGLEFGGVTAFGVDGGDMEVRRKLTSLCDNVRFTSSESLREAMERYMESVAKPGPEPAMPQLRLFYYDGANVFDETTLDVHGKRPLEVIEADRRLIGTVRDLAMAARGSFEQSLGIPADTRFQFRDAYVPSLGFRDDLLFLSRDYGRDTYTFISAAGGSLSLFRGDGETEGESRRIRTFGNIDEAMGYVSDVINHPLNRDQARREWEKYRKSQTQSASVTAGRDERKGASMKI